MQEYHSTDGYIINQNNTEHLPYGRANSAWSGCGWIASFNYLKATGCPLPEEQVADALARGWFKGRAGTGPLRLGRFLAQAGMPPAQKLCGRKKASLLAHGSKVGILLYFSSESLHYITFTAAPGGKLRFLNAEGGNEAHITSMNEFWDRHVRFPLVYLYTAPLTVEDRPRGTQTLQTPRLVLRRFAESDAEAMYTTWANDSRVTRYMRWVPHKNIDETRMVLRDWVQSYHRSDHYHWAITLKDTGAPIGSIGVLPENEPGEPPGWAVGYCLGRAYWSSGYAAEALQAALSFFVKDSAVTTVHGCHAVANPASGRVMEKAGFVFDHTGPVHLVGGKTAPAKYYVYHAPTQNPTE